MMPILLALAAIQSATPTPGPPSPPPVPVPGAPIGTALIEFMPSSVVCDGAVVTPTTLIKTLPALGSGNLVVQPFSQTVEFRIDSSGRPLSIRMNEQVDGRLPTVTTEDLRPALAAWRFESGYERAKCSVTFTTKASTVSTATIDQLHRLVALPHTGYGSDVPARRRISELSPNCFNPSGPKPLLKAFIDFDTVPEREGGISYTMTGYDIDSAGKPVNVRTLTSDGNVVLDKAAEKAISQSRFERHVRTGCSYPWYRRQDAPMTAPPVPKIADFKRPGAAVCDDDIQWVRTPVLTYPAPFARRSIEGWAIIQYDVAPWGQPGNIKVLASEPADVFGTVAKHVVAAAQRASSLTGSSGCVDRVIFKIPPKDTPAKGETASVPVAW